MNKFKNGDVVLVGLQPYFDEYVLVKYVDYSCYFPWLRKNRDIFFVYDFFTTDPFIKDIPDEEGLQLLCRPFPVKYWGVPANVIFVRNGDIEDSSNLPHLFLKVIDHDLHRQMTITGLKSFAMPSEFQVFSTKFGLSTIGYVSNERVEHLDFEWAVLSSELDLRLVFEVIKKRNLKADEIMDDCRSDDLDVFSTIMNLHPKGENNPNVRIDFDEFFRSDPYIERLPLLGRFFVEDNILSFNGLKVLDQYLEVFHSMGLIANRYGWLLLFDYLSENRTKYDFVYNGHYYQFESEAHLMAFEEMILQVTASPNLVADTLEKIPVELRERYFPSTPRCDEEPEGNLEYKELSSPSELLDIHCATRGKKKEYIINLDIESLFHSLNALFEKQDKYANGYGWEELLIRRFFPEKKDDYLDKIQPMLDAEADALAIIFKKKGDCMKSAAEIGGFIENRELLVEALMDNRDAGG